VGDCGLTPQQVDGVTELEVGYHASAAKSATATAPLFTYTMPRASMASATRVKAATLAPTT
jgi:hypothetical protein